jgi:hypothetical protein
MEYLVDGNEVLTVETVQTSTQTATVKKHYDMVINIKLSVSKDTILADGVDFATVTAKIYNYENLYQVSDQRIILFNIDGSVIEVPAVDGQASIDIDSSVSGEINIKTVNENVRNGEVVIHAQ